MGMPYARCILMIRRLFYIRDGSHVIDTYLDNRAVNENLTVIPRKKLRLYCKQPQTAHKRSRQTGFPQKQPGSAART